MARKSDDTPRPSAIKRIAALQAERRSVVARIVELEQQGIRVDVDASPNLHAAAMALVNGDDVEAAITAPGEAAELRQLFEKRAVIDRAIELLTQRETIELGERLRSAMERERAEWWAAIRKRVLTAVALQRANAEFEVYRRKYSALGTLPTSGLKLLGYGELPGDEVHRAAEECVRLGFARKKRSNFNARNYRLHPRQPVDGVQGS